MIFVMLAPIIWPFVPYLSGLEDELRDQETHTSVLLLFAVIFLLKQFETLRLKQRIEIYKWNQFCGLPWAFEYISFWIKFKDTRERFHGGWALSKCSDAIVTPRQYYWTTLHSSILTLENIWLSQNSIYGSKYEKKIFKNLVPNHLFRVCSINISVITMHWIIL